MTAHRASTVVVVGPLPPPRNGMTEMTKVVLDCVSSDFVVHHLDTSDPRPISRVARFDVRNAYLAVRHGFAFLLLLVRRRPDLVYVPVSRDRLGFLRDALFLLPARLLRRRVLVHLHAREFSEFSRGAGPALRLLIRAALSGRCRGIVLTEGMRAEFEPVISRASVSVIPNGVVDLGAGPAASSRDPVVLYLSTLWSRKGLFDFVEAAAVVHRGRPDVCFVLAGGWLRDDERVNALGRIEALGLGSVFRVVGPVEPAEKRALLHEAAVLCLPSHDEGLPLVVLEAFAAGTPVVASDVGGIPDALIDGEQGYLHAPGDVEAIAGRVGALLADAELRGRLGRAARARFEERYTVERFSAALAGAWRDALIDQLSAAIVEPS